ncbi:unnamed protein product [Adineta steineri]|uniref:EGF-like domain-containing protein n=1 Tax=Adineta steineri TaxID=433720 RepID=A0A814L488_9BILA|nr:unnamed protein product [Adineta steineri]
MRDGMYSTDCLDGTDEKDFQYAIEGVRNPCVTTPIFRCEERTIRYPWRFSCGDGEFLVLDIPQLSQRCHNLRDLPMSSSIFTSLDHISDLNCRQALYCLLRINEIFSDAETASGTHCESLIDHCSSKWVVLPEYPIIYRFFQFIYLTNRSINEFKTNLLPDFICFNSSRCPALIYCSIDIGIQNGLHCCKTINLINETLDDWYFIDVLFRNLIQRCSTIGTTKTCSSPSLFHYESFSACQLNDSKRFICSSEPNKCLSIVSLENGKTDCLDGEDELTSDERNAFQGLIPFVLICNGIYDFLSVKNLSEIDETHCDWWPCNNPYVRCDNIWHCLNGDDELNCPRKNCSFNEHECYNDYLNKYYCIRSVNLMESYLDCEDSRPFREIYFNNITMKNNTYYFLWNQTKCIISQHICQQQQQSFLPSTEEEDICLMQPFLRFITQIATVFIISDEYRCRKLDGNPSSENSKPFLITSQLSYFPSITSNIISPEQTNNFYNGYISLEERIYGRTDWYCNRGIVIFYKSNKTKKCFCPPSYFGSRCQWQNQRISLTLQFIYHSSTYLISIFQILITIIDQQREISSYHEQITYVPKRDCNTKFNLYLLYPDQPKNSSSNYSIHIDIYNKTDLTYWGSWHLSIPFQFLPVNRIATQLFLSSNEQPTICPLSCGIHGKCIAYINNNSSYFCKCNQGYSSICCEKEHNCSCSSDSLCITSSICICPINKFGSKCYLKHSFCQSCENNGLCIPNDNRFHLTNNFTCLCQEEFYGIRCENTKNQIDIEFNEEIIKKISLIFAHYITAFQNAKHQHTTTLKKIIYGQNTIKLFITQPFHIILIEISKQNYYLAVLRERFIQSENIKTEILSNQKCFHINELVNKTFQLYPLYNRIKYYPLISRQYKNLSLSLSNQPLLIQIIIGITTLMFIFGLISGILSILTFHMKKTRDIGCGFYLFISSWNSMLTLIILIIKFWQLILSQMFILNNRSILYMNCLILDMIIQVCLTFNDYLYARVSIERVITVHKWISLCIFILIMLTHIHDPIHRHLIDDIDTDEQRIWCVVQYSSSIHIYNSFITLFHFLLPLLINIIISIARSRLTIQPRLTFKEHLQLHLKQHKSHLIALCTLIF